MPPRRISTQPKTPRNQRIPSDCRTNLYIIRNYNHNPAEERHLTARPRKKQSAQRRGNWGAGQATGATRGVTSDGCRCNARNGTCHDHGVIALDQQRVIRAGIFNPSEDQRNARI